MTKKNCILQEMSSWENQVLLNFYPETNLNPLHDVSEIEKLG